MEMIKQTPHRAAQVEEMWITDCPFENFNKRTLLNTFPNLRQLTIEHDEFISSDECLYFSEPIEMTHSKSRIEVLYDSLHCELASQMLVSNLCNKLERPVLSFSFRRGISSQTVLKQLKNASVLKDLTLEHAEIGATDLENLHNNVPSLQAFNLFSICPIESEIPTNIKPVTSIRMLVIEIARGGSSDVQIDLYRYLIKKYHKVPDIEHEDHIDYLSSDKAAPVYRNDILEFYRSIKARQTYLSLHGVPDDINIFEVLDNMGWKLCELCAYRCQEGTFFRYLARSKQSKSIQKLRLNQMRVGSSLRRMTALTTLELVPYIRSAEIATHLTRCLNACPTTLKNLTVTYPILYISPPQTHLTCIQNLKIECNNCDDQLGQVLSTCFPKLVRLDVTAKTFSTMNVVLHSPFFQEASFSTSNMDWYGLTFRVTSEIKPQFYHFTKDSKELVKYKDIQDLPTLNVTSLTRTILDLSTGNKITVA